MGSNTPGYPARSVSLYEAVTPAGYCRHGQNPVVISSSTACSSITASASSAAGCGAQADVHSAKRQKVVEVNGTSSLQELRPKPLPLLQQLSVQKAASDLAAISKRSVPMPVQQGGHQVRSSNVPAAAATADLPRAPRSYYKKRLKKVETGVRPSLRELRPKSELLQQMAPHKVGNDPAAIVVPPVSLPPRQKGLQARSCNVPAATAETDSICRGQVSVDTSSTIVDRETQAPSPQASCMPSPREPRPIALPVLQQSSPNLTANDSEIPVVTHTPSTPGRERRQFRSCSAPAAMQKPI
ncbi:MAG: hypothetical protein SEPTF4163_003548 [Sporothrix epigloea]